MKPLFCISSIRIFSAIILLAILPIFLSCSKELDFDQTDAFELENEMAFNLVYFEVTPQDFDGIGTGSVTPFLTETAAIAEFQEAFVQNNLQEATLTFGVSSTLDRAIASDVIFTNANGDVTYVIDLASEASAQGEEIFTEQEVVIAGTALDRFKQSRFIQIRIAVESDTAPSGGGLKFKSKGLFRFVY